MSDISGYSDDQQAVFDAVNSATGNGLLISQCQDTIDYLEKIGYKLIKTEDVKAVLEKELVRIFALQTDAFIRSNLIEVARCLTTVIKELGC